MTCPEHPDRETLGRFGLGRLDRKGMAAVEGHLRACSRCGRIASRAPDDRLVTLLRASTADLAAEPSPVDTADPPRRQPEPPPRKTSSKRRPRNLGMIVVLLCLAGVLGVLMTGCSGERGPADLSPEAQAKAREASRKKFRNDGTKAAPKTKR